MRIVLHIGAHKTASTHLQLALARARPRLAERGVALFGPDELRRRGLGLPEYLAGRLAEHPADDTDNPDLEAHAARLRAAFDVSAGRLVLSDENILGNAHNARMIREARFYPQAAERLRALAALLPLAAPATLTIALAIRDPASFLTSAYAQRLMSGRIEGFERYLSGLDPAQLSWAEALRRMQTALPDVEWVVWRYEDYPSVAPAALSALLGEAAELVEPGSNVAHPGMSAAAVAAVMAEADALSAQDEATIRARVAALRAALPKGANPAYDPFDDATRTRIQAAHAKDLHAITDLSRTRCLWD